MAESRRGLTAADESAVTPNDPGGRAPPLTVLYDGACPLCRREIGHARRVATGSRNAGIDFLDISDSSCALPGAPTRDRLLGRFHVRRPDGTWVAGAAAFTEMWSRLPGWRWAARVARWPGMLPILEQAYRGFLLVRPSLQRLAQRFERTPGP